MSTCKETRKAIAADPSTRDVGAHVGECASCREFQAEMQALDAKIASALSVNVPEPVIPELPEIDTANVTTLSTRRIRPPVWLAMAATIAVAAVIGFRFVANEAADAPLAEQILAHIDHEPYSLRVTDEAVSDRRLDRVVHADLATMDRNIGLITYAQSCRINGRIVPHLVIKGERGPITILLMPDEDIGDKAQEFGGGGLSGVLLPVGKGSIAIVGEDGERLDSLENKVLNSVRWTT